MKVYRGKFPSPRGVELHKPGQVRRSPLLRSTGFRPLAGLSCINPSARSMSLGVDPSSFRPLAGLSCINLSKKIVVCCCFGCVSVPSRG